MRRDTRRRWLLAICGALIGLSPAGARADGPESGFWWSPSLRITGVVDDNLFTSKTNTNGDVGFWIAPRVEAGYRGSAFAVGADVGVDVRQYIDEGGAVDDQLIRAIGWAEVSLAPGLELRIADAYVPQAVVLGLPEDDTLNSVQSNRADATLRWSRELAGGRSLSVGAVGTHFLSEEHPEAMPATGGGFTVDPSFGGSYLQGLGFIQVDSPLAERTNLWVRTQASYRDFSELSDADHANVSVLFGIDSERWRGLELSAAVGGGALIFDGLGTGYRVLGRLRALRRFEQGLSVWLSGRHLHTPDLTGDQVDETTAELGFEQRLGSATSLAVRGLLTHYDAPLVGGGSNLFGGAEVSLRRQLSRRIQVGVSYRYWSNGGSFASDDFAQNRVGVELGFRL